MSMNETELEKLCVALNGIHLAMGGKEMSDAAMGFWVHTLRDLDFEEVKEALVTWAKTQKFLPKPADIVERVNKKRVQVYEAKRKAEEMADRSGCQKIDVEAFRKKILESIDDSEPIGKTMERRARAILAAIEQGKSEVSLFNVVKNGKQVPNKVPLLPIHEWWAKRVLGIKY